MAFQEEQVIARIRRSWWSLLLPLLSLFLAGAILSYVSNRVLEPWLVYVAYAVAGVLAFFFWLMPTIRHLNFYVELTTSRLIVRDGIFAQKTAEISLAEVAGIELLRGRSLAVNRRSGERAVFTRVPKCKWLAAEIRAASNLSA